jgi:hypothetical protein
MKLFRFLKNVWVELWKNAISHIVIGMGVIWGICFILGFIYRIIGIPIPYQLDKSNGYFFDTLALGWIIVIVLMIVGVIIFGGKSVLQEIKKVWNKS